VRSYGLLRTGRFRGYGRKH